MNKIWYTPEVLALLRKRFYLSPETLHKIMNPYCPQCLIERGRKCLENFNRE